MAPHPLPCGTKSPSGSTLCSPVNSDVRDDFCHPALPPLEQDSVCELSVVGGTLPSRAIPILLTVLPCTMGADVTSQHIGCFY